VVDGDRRADVFAEVFAGADDFEGLGALGQRLGEVRARDVGELAALRRKGPREQDEDDEDGLLEATAGDEAHAGRSCPDTIGFTRPAHSDLDSRNIETSRGWVIDQAAR
jgi:hypothetical protein